MPRGALAAVAGGAVVAAALPWLLDDFLVSLALSCLMYVALATSWAMFSGATRYVSLGTSAFFGLGAYVSAWTVAAAPWPVVIAGGALVAAAFAALAGLAILHLRGTYFAVLTFGMSELTRHVVTYGEKQYAGTVGRVLTGVPSNRTVYFTVLVIAVAAVVVAVAVRGSRFGLALIGIGADEQRAQTLGVPTRWVITAKSALSWRWSNAGNRARSESRVSSRRRTITALSPGSNHPATGSSWLSDESRLRACRAAYSVRSPSSKTPTIESAWSTPSKSARRAGPSVHSRWMASPTRLPSTTPVAPSTEVASTRTHVPTIVSRARSAKRSIFSASSVSPRSASRSVPRT